MGFDITLDKLYILCLHCWFHYCSKLFFVYQFQVLVFVLDNSNLSWSVLLCAYDLSLLLVGMSTMKGVVFWAIAKVIITQAVLKTGYDWVKIFDMIVFVIIERWMSARRRFARIEEEIWNLLPKLWSYVYLGNTIYFTFVKYFTLSTLEEAQIWNLKTKVDFLINTWN